MWCPRSRSGGANYGGSENELSVLLYLEVLVSAKQRVFTPFSDDSLVEGRVLPENWIVPAYIKDMKLSNPDTPSKEFQESNVLLSRYSKFWDGVNGV
jgi:hypothetical protein